MNEYDRLTRTQQYLDELERELQDIPSSQRVELIEGVRTRIEERWAATEDQSLAGFLKLLARLGDPKALAEAERARLGLPAAPRRGPGLLEIAAVVGTALFWPVGVVLAWLSPRWLIRDKAVATALPIVGLMLLFAAAAPMSVTTTEVPAPASVAVEVPASGSSAPTEFGTSGGTPAVETSQRSAETTLALFSMVLVVFGVAGAPLFSAIYLVLRMGPRRRQAAVAIPAAVAALLAVTAIIALTRPMA
jgi:hypothetical protein